MNSRGYHAVIFLSAITLRQYTCDGAYERKHSHEDTVWLDFENPSAIITDRTENSTYFGASIALHKSGGGEAWLFIGAPKANDAASNPGISNPGKVWRCNLDLGTSSPLSGVTGTMCPSQSPRGWTRTNGWSCDRMFLGASVVASRDKLITCAPRWGRVTYWGDRPAQGTEGACYWFQLPNVTRTFHPLQYSPKQLLIPIADQNFVNADSRLDPGRFTRWEQGQFGFSAHVSKFKEQLVAGAVGVFRFDGGVILPPPILQPADSPKWTMFSTELLTHQAYTQSESLCNPPTAGNIWIRAVHSGYLGYSVTSGRYFNDYEEMVATGGPRSSGGRPCGQLLGSALIMRYTSAAPSEWVRPKASTHREYRWKPYATVGGGGLGSYFGAAMESVDINNDGKDDLIVGAPLECGAEGGKADKDCTGSEDAGCVYIYSHLWKPARYGATWKHSQWICAEVPWGRFGAAIAGLGDVDQDGFNDFAVGAPSEGNFGAVYVFFGRRANKELQRLRISGGYRSGVGTITPGFGQSIIGDVDLDGNGTPDFAVGSYVNQTVTLFRTRPKLNLTSSLEFFRDGSSERTTTLAQTDMQFRIKYCLNISLVPRDLSRQKNMTLWNRLDVDENHNRFKLQHANQFELTFRPNERMKCVEFEAVRTQPVTDAEDFPDITFSAHAWYSAPNATMLTPLTRRGLDPKSELLFSRQESSDFCTECPYSMTRIFNDLPALAFAIDCMKRGDSLKLPVCKPVFTIEMHYAAEPSPRTSDPIVLGYVSNVLVTVTVTNTNQTAFRPALKFSVKLVPPSDGSDSSKIRETMTPPMLVETAQAQPCLTSPSNDQATKKSQEVCQLIRKVLRKGGEETLTYSLRMSNVVALRRSRAPTKLELGAKVFLEHDAEFKHTKQSLTVNVIAADANVTVGSPPIAERLPLITAMSSKRTLDAKFQVKLGGQSPVRVKLFVGLPASLPSVRSRKLFEIHRPDGDCSVKSECWVCQYANVPMKNWAGRRALETLARNISANASTNCLSSRNLACEYFSCEKDISLYRNILADFHLDVSAESEKRIGELMPSTGLRLVGFAYAYVFDDRDGAVVTDNSACLFEFNLLPPEQNEIEAWIIIAAAASALLILSCVIFGLCKCGFFKREKKELLLAQQQGGDETEEVSNGHIAEGCDQSIEQAF